MYEKVKTQLHESKWRIVKLLERAFFFTMLEIGMRKLFSELVTPNYSTVRKMWTFIKTLFLLYSDGIRKLEDTY